MRQEFNVQEEYYFMRIDIAHEIKDRLMGMDEKSRKSEMSKLDGDMAEIVRKLMGNRLN